MVWADPKGNVSIQFILMFFPQLDHGFPALPVAAWAQGWPSKDLAARAHCEGSDDAFGAGPGTTRVSLSQFAFKSQGKNCWISRKRLQLHTLASP